MTSGGPFFFAGNMQLYGWLHEPADSARRDVAVLLCPPLGHEYMCAYRSIRWLAEKLAEAGFATMRFDYAGTGNSGPPHRGTSMLPAWRASIDAAANELVARTGCDHVSFVGLRMGATLASLIAESRRDVASLVMIAPCSSGRSYIRQTRILGANAAAHPEDVAHEDGTIEAAGFAFDPATAAEISELSASFVRAPAPRALIMERDDLPDAKFTAALKDAGVACDEAHCHGYADFMRSPIQSVLPVAPLTRIVEWLSAAHPQSTTTAAPTAWSQNATSATWNGTYDVPVRIGGRLAGVLTRPSEDDSTDLTAVLLLNTGGDHHVGPHGAYVPLARDWASRGYAVLRFDLRGIGDSGTLSDSPRLEAYPPTAMSDVSAGWSFLRDNCGYEHVFVAGMCSGGFHALHAAARMPLAGVIAVNPPLYWQPGDVLDEDPHAGAEVTRRTRRALLRPAKWWKLVRGGVNVFEHVRNIKMALFAAGGGVAERLRGSPMYTARVAGLLPPRRGDIAHIQRAGSGTQVLSALVRAANARDSHAS